MLGRVSESSQHHPQPHHHHKLNSAQRRKAGMHKHRHQLTVARHSIAELHAQVGTLQAQVRQFEDGPLKSGSDDQLQCGHLSELAGCSASASVQPQVGHSVDVLMTNDAHRPASVDQLQCSPVSVREGSSTSDPLQRSPTCLQDTVSAGAFQEVLKQLREQEAEITNLRAQLREKEDTIAKLVDALGERYATAGHASPILPSSNLPTHCGSLPASHASPEFFVLYEGDEDCQDHASPVLIDMASQTDITAANAMQWCMVALPAINDMAPDDADADIVAGRAPTQHGNPGLHGISFSSAIATCEVESACCTNEISFNAAISAKVAMGASAVTSPCVTSHASPGLLDAIAQPRGEVCDASSCSQDVHSDDCNQLQCGHLDDACVHDENHDVIHERQDASSCSQDAHSDVCNQLQCSHLDVACVYDEHQDSSFSAATSACQGGERFHDAGNILQDAHSDECDQLQCGHLDETCICEENFNAHSGVVHQFQCGHLDAACAHDKEWVDSCFSATVSARDGGEMLHDTNILYQDAQSDECTQLQCGHLGVACVNDDKQDLDSNDSSFNAAILACEGGERLHDTSNDSRDAHSIQAHGEKVKPDTMSASAPAAAMTADNVISFSAAISASEKVFNISTAAVSASEKGYDKDKADTVISYSAATSACKQGRRCGTVDVSPTLTSTPEVANGSKVESDNDADEDFPEFSLKDIPAMPSLDDDCGNFTRSMAARLEFIQQRITAYDNRQRS